MKVLFVNINDSSGGAARATMRIMRGVQQCGVEARMFVKYKYTQSQDVISILQFIPNNPVYKLMDWIVSKIKNKWQHFQWRPYEKTKRDAYMSDLRSTSIHGALQKLDYDVVHLHWINMRFLDIRELAKIKKPIVWTLHDSWAFCSICHVPYDCKKYQNHCGACPMLGSSKERDLAYKVFEKKLSAYKDLNLHIVTPSKWLAECARHSALFGRYPVTVIPNCIDTERFKPMVRDDVRKQLRLDHQKKYLLFGAWHATSDKNKGFELLISALCFLKNENVELIIYGTDEDMENYSIPVAYRSIGYVLSDERMTQLCNIADVTVVPSLSENLSNTIMESLSCGTPVVAFNIGGNSDMIEHKKNGYLVKERDCEDLARGIDWCLNNNKENALGRAAHEKVMNNYTIDIVSEQYKRLYESL